MISQSKHKQISNIHLLNETNSCFKNNTVGYRDVTRKTTMKCMNCKCYNSINNYTSSHFKKYAVHKHTRDELQTSCSHQHWVQQPHMKRYTVSNSDPHHTGKNTPRLTTTDSTCHFGSVYTGFSHPCGFKFFWTKLQKKSKAFFLLTWSTSHWFSCNTIYALPPEYF